MQVAKVLPNTPAEKAGLQPGDIIRSANGYLTEVPGNLTWITENAAADQTLRLTVLSSKDGRERTITATVPK